MRLGSIGASQLRQPKQTAHLAPVTALHTERLLLHPTDVAEAERIVARERGPEDSWAPDFPFGGEFIGVTAFPGPRPQTATNAPSATTGSPEPLTGKRSAASDSRASPTLAASRLDTGSCHPLGGNGFAAEAARALVALARRHGLSRIVAHTDEDSIASQRTLERAGFRQTGTNGTLYLYAIALAP